MAHALSNWQNLHPLEWSGRMTFRQFFAFSSVARHMSITKAAYELHTSQPTLSRDLKGLEESYKIRLLKRAGRGVELTEDGIEFLKYTEPILEQLQRIEKRFSNDPQRITSHQLRVGGSYVLAASVLPALLGVFRKKNQTADVLLRSSDCRTLEQMIIKCQLELALTCAPAASHELIVEPCVPLRLTAFAAKSFALPHIKGKAAYALENLPLIVCDEAPRERGMGSPLTEYERTVHKLNVIMRCESLEAVVTAVRDKLGVGILYEDIVRKLIARGVFKRVPLTGMSLVGNSFIILHKDSPISGNAEQFLHLLREWCEKKRKVASTESSPV
jgi:DNA-binding transcriptional LysR family regulator